MLTTCSQQVGIVDVDDGDNPNDIAGMPGGDGMSASISPDLRPLMQRFGSLPLRPLLRYLEIILGYNLRQTFEYSW